jgi:25S rRNA (uracil2843-N3)-methyltransferase
VQEIKAKLFDQRWLEVFEDHRLLDAYAGRWVPSRAVCFRELFAALSEVRALFLGQGDNEDGENDEEGVTEDGQPDGEGSDFEADELDSKTAAFRLPEADTEASSSQSKGEVSSSSSVLSLGGGAGSELLALASILKSVHSSSKGKERAWSWTGIDIGAWSSVLDKLSGAIEFEWGLGLSISYTQGNLLSFCPKPHPHATSRSCDDPDDAEPESYSPPHAGLASILDRDQPKLITLLFTLTELFSQSRSSTLALLRLLTSHSPSGALFLVADSASDISEFELGSAGRKWPVFMILDMVMLSKDGDGKPGWEKVAGEESRWYRLPEGVGAGWPVKLENTRYWYRLYRRL